MIMIAIFATLITAIAMFFVATKFLEDQAKASTNDVVKQINSNLNNYLHSIYELGYYSENELRSIPLSQKSVLVSGIKMLTDSRSDIVTIALFDNKGNQLFSNNSYTLKENFDITKESWFLQPFKREGDHYYSTPHVQTLYQGQFPWIVSYSKSVRYLDEDEKLQQGILLIDFKLDRLEDITLNAKMGKEGYSFIIDSSYNIVYHPKQHLINTNLYHENIDLLKDLIVGARYYNKEYKLIVINTIDSSRFRLITIAYLDTVKEELILMALTVLVTIFIILILAILISTIISKRITMPLKLIESKMRSIEKGNFNITLNEIGSYETAALAREFNIMISQIKYLLETSLQHEKTKRKLELEALQAKINPHFLYNTLDSVVWLAETGDTKGVIKIISALAKLFRISISKGHDIITIQEELEHVSNYLTIQKMRYNDAFKFFIECPDELKSIPTIKLIIQPIVENSIYHGIKYLQDEGFIRIEVSECKIKDEDAIMFKISDNGIGMSKEKLDQLNSGLKQSTQGIGFVNVMQRIKIQYGNDYYIKVDSELEEGTTVTLFIKKNPPIKFIKGNI